MAIILANNATAKLAGAIIPESSILVLQVGQGEAFPSPSSPDWFPVTIVDSAGGIEICKCTSRSGDVLTVSRAQEGTSAKAFAVGSRVSLRITKAVLDYISSVTNPLSELSPSPDKIAYYTGSQTASLATLTEFARSILDDTSASAVLSTLGVSSFIKTVLDDADSSALLASLGFSNFVKGLIDDRDAATFRSSIGAQAHGATLSALAALTCDADNLPYFNGADSMAKTPLSSLARNILGMTTGAAIANQIGAIKTTDVGFKKAASGYVAIPLSDSSKIYIQWGKTGPLVANGNVAVTFPTAFPAVCYVVVTGNPTGGPTSSSSLTTSAPTTSGFTMYGDSETTTPNGGYWVAIGY